MMNKDGVLVPHPGEYGEYYQGYIDMVENPIVELDAQTDFFKILMSQYEDKLDYAYASDKWTLRELLMHIIDSETIFLYRALRISRGDKTPLPSFEQNDYIEDNSFSHIDKQMLQKLFISQRQLIKTFYKSLVDEQLLRKGIASGYPCSVRALLYIIVGHFKHHQGIIESRYL